MINTGIFFHYQHGDRLGDFPEALGGLLDQSNVLLYDALYPLKQKASYELEPVSQELLRKVHSERMLKQVELSPYYETSLYSAGGTVQAAERIWESEITNAFVFTGAGDHHAGRDFFGGWCYLNGAALAIKNLRERYGARRFAIVDTDAHHGDGTWDIFKDDEDVLYICFCGQAFMERKSNVNISVPYMVTNEDYLNMVEDEVAHRCRSFQPELLFWNWGYDGTQGDYGDMGLTADCHIQLARIIKMVAGEVCNGRLIVILCGGQSRSVATYAIPRIIKCLAGSE